MDDELAEKLKEMCEEAKKYRPCMSLHVNEDGQCVELLLDTNRDTYHEWIPGEGGDIGLVRDFETGKVVGVRLPLLNPLLSVFYNGPLKINNGFLKDESPSDKR